MNDQRRKLPIVAAAGDGCCSPIAAESLEVEQAVTVARMFKALGDPVRLRLLSIIASTPGESCVCDLISAFDLTGATISHHLRILREAGLVDSQRRGTWVYYWPLRDNLQQLSWVLDTRPSTPLPDIAYLPSSA